MIQLQFFTSIKKIEDSIKTLYDQHSCIINLETENINSNKLIVYAENHNLPTYKVLEASFIYDLIENILQTNKKIILGLAGIDKKNIYALIEKLNSLDIEDKEIILIYHSINVIKDGIININQINDREKFDEILSVYENSDILGFRFNKWGLFSEFLPKENLFQIFA